MGGDPRTGFIYRRKHKYESKLSALLGFGGFADLLVAAFNDKLYFHLVLHVLTLPGGMRESGHDLGRSSQAQEVSPQLSRV